MTKRKSDYSQTEVEITPEIRELSTGFTAEQVQPGVVAGGFAAAESGGEGMERGLFEDLMESIEEAGAILRGEREAARRTNIDDSVG